MADVIFVWDPDKDRSNIAKHRLPLSLAAAMFEGHVQEDRPALRVREERVVARGIIAGSVHVCVYTVRDQVKRVISLRRADRRKPMPITSITVEEAKKLAAEFDWSEIDAMTDEDIARQIAENPDAAPDTSEMKMRSVYPVTAMRQEHGFSQEEFARFFSVDIETVQAWERGETYPEGSALSLLRILYKEPEAFKRALLPKKAA